MLDTQFRWLEDHSVTVDLMKWAAVILFAWAAGLLSFVRRKIRGPKVEIVAPASLCYLDRGEQVDAPKGAVRSVFLLRVGVANRRESEITVRSFAFAYRKKRPLRKFAAKIGPCTLPDIPRTEMGAGTKLHSVWFSRYPDSTEGLVVHGRIASCDYKEGYLLFVANTHGSWNPEVKKGQLQVEVAMLLAAGGGARTRAKIRVCDNMNQLEKLVPGLADQVKHESSWNIPWR